MVHISQVATRRIDKVEDELRVDDVITVKVLDVDPEAKRISLSRRAVLQPERERPQRNHDSYDEDREPSYKLPPIEEAKVTLADFFPKWMILKTKTHDKSTGIPVLFCSQPKLRR